MRQSILIYLLNESDFHRPIDFISLSFFPNIAAVVAAPILDIKFEGNNLKVTIQSSKTDQIGNSITFILPQNKHESMCVARQLKAYLKMHFQFQ
jgi:hypothetical protein